jgi:hypothetical protein
MVMVTVNFLHCTAGIHGEKHPMHGWIIDMKLWIMFLQYLSWCADEQLDYRFHVCRVQEGDEYYIRMVSEKLKSFGAEDRSDKVVHSCGETVKKHQINLCSYFLKQI